MVRNRPPPPLACSSPDAVGHPVGLVAVGLAVAGVLGAAGRPVVPPQRHGPVGEDRHAFGDASAGPEGTDLRDGHSAAEGNVTNSRSVSEERLRT